MRTEVQAAAAAADTTYFTKNQHAAILNAGRRELKSEFKRPTMRGGGHPKYANQEIGLCLIKIQSTESETF